MARHTGRLRGGGHLTSDRTHGGGEKEENMGYRLGIDIGGTFTDFVAYDDAATGAQGLEESLHAT